MNWFTFTPLDVASLVLGGLLGFFCGDWPTRKLLVVGVPIFLASYLVVRAGFVLLGWT